MLHYFECWFRNGRTNSRMQITTIAPLDLKGRGLTIHQMTNECCRSMSCLENTSYNKNRCIQVWTVDQADLSTLIYGVWFSHDVNVFCKVCPIPHWVSWTPNSYFCDTFCLFRIYIYTQFHIRFNFSNHLFPLFGHHKRSFLRYCTTWFAD